MIRILCAVGGISALVTLTAPVAVAQCTDSTTVLYGVSHPITRIDGNTVRAYVETYTVGNYRSYYWNYLEAWAYRDGAQIGHYPEYSPQGQNLTASRTFTATLQFWGPGRYTSLGRHRAFNYVCSIWEPSFDTGTVNRGYLDVIRPARPDYSSLPGVTRSLFFLGTGIDVSGQYLATTLLVVGDAGGAPGTPQWIFKAGSSFGAFGTTSGSQVSFRASRKGSGCSVYDVVIANSYGGFESEPMYIFINGPHSTEAAYDDFGDYWKVPDIAWGNGWWTRFNYKTKSLCSYDAPMSYYEMNEAFGGWNAGVSWRPPDPNGFDVGGDQWSDTMSFDCPAQDCTPLPLNPGPDFTSVQFAQQTWRVGSKGIAQGAPVQINKHHRYRDQGEHEAIINPAVP